MRLKTILLVSLCGTLCAVTRPALGEGRNLTIVSAGDAFMVQRFPSDYSVAPQMKAWIASGDARLVNFETVVNDGTCRPAAWRQTW